MEARPSRVVEWDGEHVLSWLFETGQDNLADAFLDKNVSGRALIHFATFPSGQRTLEQYLGMAPGSGGELAARLQAAFAALIMPAEQTAESENNSAPEPDEPVQEERYISSGEDGEIKHFRCGYCKSGQNSSFCLEKSNISIREYEQLKDVGWSRSGFHLYRPIPQLCCCPHYQIRVIVERFEKSRAQQRVWRRVQAFLRGDAQAAPLQPQPQPQQATSAPAGSAADADVSEMLAKVIQKAVLTAARQHALPYAEEIDFDKLNYHVKIQQRQKGVEFISGICLSLAAEIMAREQAEQRKLAQQQPDHRPAEPPLDFRSSVEVATAALVQVLSSDSDKLVSQVQMVPASGHLSWFLERPGFVKPQKSQPFQKVDKKSTQQAESVAPPKASAHNLQVSFHRPVFDQEVFDLYKSYQERVHEEKDTTPESYTRFLINTPLRPEEAPEGSILPGYGTFHMHYRLNGKLIAVAVLDILPQSIVSVYFFWDRTYEDLNLGTFSALNELDFALRAGITYYYLGWYVHTSKKMNYKASYAPTMILCPDTHVYVPLDATVRAKLDEKGYARLCDDAPLLKRPSKRQVDSAIVQLQVYPPMRFGALAEFLEAEEAAQLSKRVQLYTFFCSPSLAANITLKCPN